MKILCTADLHIGRRSTRLPPGSDSRQHSCAAAWLRIVEAALSAKVELVVVSGDFIDQSNRFFEALGAVEAGVRRLRSAGVQVLVVGGNHDFDVARRVVETIGDPGFRMLGGVGEWEWTTVSRGDFRLHVGGWSFTSEHHPQSPLSVFREPRDDAPVLAVLHADLDQPRSAYAPISVAELRRYPRTFFALGHVHATRSIEEPGGARALYSGSPQAMDPAELGDHGVYVLDASRAFAATFLPVSSVRYETIDVSTEEVTRIEEVDQAIAVALRRRLQELADVPHLAHLRARIRLTGRTALHRQLAEQAQNRAQDLELEEGGRLTGSIERVVTDTRPARDIAAIAEAGGPPAILARMLRELEAGGAGVAGLLQETKRAAREVIRSSSYAQLESDEGDEEPDEAALRREVERAAVLLLDELVAQKEPVR